MCTSQKISKMKKYIITSADGKWNKVYEKELPYGEEVIAFNKEWIDKDFNPNDTRVGFLGDDGFISAEWKDEWDEYVTHYEEGEVCKAKYADALDENANSSLVNNLLRKLSCV